MMMPHLWTPLNQGIDDDEIRHKLEYCPRHQWKSSARTEDNMETMKYYYEETIKCLMHRLKTVCQERDEARHRIQVLLTKFHPCSPQDMSNKESSVMSYKSLSSSHCDLSLASDDRAAKASSDYCSRDVNMLNRLVCGKPLPEKGRLLRTVTEAGPLLHTLLLEPLPQWRNPPPFDNDNDDKADDVVIPTTSLSLAFHGDPRIMSSPSLCPGIVSLNHGFTRKKRRFL